jgi:hypothetical protein
MILIQSLFLPCATCLVEKQQIPIYGLLLDPTEALTHDRGKHTNNYITNVLYYKYIIASYDKYAK